MMAGMSRRLKGSQPSRIRGGLDETQLSSDKELPSLPRRNTGGRSEMTAYAANFVAAAIGKKKVAGQINNAARNFFREALVEYRVPDKPRRRFQKYRMTLRGRAGIPESRD
jgi:hypothetical protein